MKCLSLSLICLAALTTRSYARTIDTRPIAPITAATELQARAMNVGPDCVAATVGIIRKEDDAGRMTVGSGSGVIVSADGLIMTAGHVIEKPGTALTIRFADGRVLRGVAVGLDHASDIGLARITDAAPAGGWKFAPIAPDDSARLSEWVLATGNPGSVVVDRNPPLRLGRVIAHDAKTLTTNCALEPGDSGGPVFDLDGRVVGINSRIATSPSDQGHIKEYLSMHVPVSIFTRQRNELLAGMNAHPDVVLGSNNSRRKARRGVVPAAAPDLTRIAEAVQKLVSENDPEALKLLEESKANGGKMNLSGDDALKLIARAALPPSAETSQLAGSAANGIPADLRASIAPRIKSSLEKQFPGAKISEALLSRIMDASTFDPAKR